MTMGRQQKAILKKRKRVRKASAVGKKHQVQFAKTPRSEAAISCLTLCGHDVTGEFPALADLATIAISYLRDDMTPDLRALVEDEPWRDASNSDARHAIWLTHASFLECQEIIREILRHHQRRLYVRQIVVLAICAMASLEQGTLSERLRYQLSTEK